MIWDRWTRQKHWEQKLDAELRFHVEQQIQNYVQGGDSPEEARRRALLDFGGLDQIKEECRESRPLAWLEILLKDMRYAVRTLCKSRAFTATGVATLALAIGANATIFSIVNAVLLQSLPFRSPEQLVMLWTGTPSQNLQGRPDYLTVEEWRRRTNSFTDIAVLDPVSVTLTNTDGAEKISVARVSPNFFSLLGIQPLKGRSFSNEEAEERRHVAVISHRFWQTRFGASPDVIGESIVLDGLASQIIGILPAGLDLPRLNADVWEPHTIFPDWETRRTVRGAGSWFVIGRLRREATVDQAQAEMSTIARVLDDELPPADRNHGISVVPLNLYVVGARSRIALWMLTGAVFCVLLIAAANVASLSLARSVGRAREMAIRAALGATSLRIVRQLLAEGIALATIAGVLGSLLAFVGIRLIQSFGPTDLARLSEVSVDLRVLGWALAISLLAGTLIGLTPAITISRRNFKPSSEEGGRRVSGGLTTRKTRSALVATEFALAVILMAGAGLLMRSWWNIGNVDLGFSAERVLSIQMSAPAAMEPKQRANFYAGVLEQVESLAGVESAGTIGDLFIGSDSEQILSSEGNAGNSQRMRLRRDEISPKLFTTIGVRLLQGRFFSPEDGPDSQRVAIINDAMARRLWPGRDPLGRRFKFGTPDSDRAWFTVVGVVDDMRRQGLETDPIPQMFEPLAQNPSRLETFLVRTSADDPLTMAATVQAAVRRVERDAPLYGITTLEDRLGIYLAQRRFQTSLLIGFSIIALLMAAIGIYGLIHYSVATRTQEIGIRMAVGARRTDILRMIMSQGVKPVLLGVVIGMVASYSFAGLIANQLYGVSPTDRVTLVVAPFLLVAVAALASYLPARHAARLDPIQALRTE